MKCASCTHISLEEKEMSRHRFGECAFDEPGRYKSLNWERNCKLFVLAEAHVVAARAAWLANPKSILQEEPCGSK